jgi:hypothetical protein
VKAPLACALALVGCYDTDPLYCQMHGSDSINCPRIVIDSSGNAGCYNIDSLGLVACAVTPPTAAIVIPANATLDTGTGVSSQADLSCAMLKPGSADVCLVAGTTVSIAAAATLAVTGPRPLVIGADTMVMIDGTVDVASHRAGLVGPNADAAGCNPGTVTAFGGGGAGGSFGTAGGNGGLDANNAGPGSTAGAVLTPATLRGGCAGTDATAPGSSPGGHSGGAVALVAATIAIGGTINASGAAGGGGNTSGGGGGGTGGMIALHAGALAVNPAARVFANGGGGGGATDSNGNPGQPGGDPTGPPMGGGGGSGANTAGDGGAGYPATTTNGAKGANNLDGGGGGGGGAGVIVTSGTTAPSGPNISPPSK